MSRQAAAALCKPFSLGETNQLHGLLEPAFTLLAETSATATTGSAKPEALKHDFAGYWSRRITNEHRLAYKITGDQVRIAACRYHYG